MSSLWFLQDPASIPQVCATYINVAYMVCWILGPVLFAAAILSEMHSGIQGNKVNYTRIFVRTTTILVGLVIYKWIFLGIVAFCQVLSYSMFSMEDWGALQAGLTKSMECGYLNVFKLSLHEIISAAAVVAAQVSEHILNFVRYIFLGILYSLGPIVFILGIWPGKEKLINNWFKLVFGVSLWVVILRVLQGIFTNVVLSAQIVRDIKNFSLDPVSLTILVVTYIGLLWSAPALTGAIFASGAMGMIGSAVTAGASAAAGLITGTGAGGTRIGAKGVAGKISGGISGVARKAAGIFRGGGKSETTPMPTPAQPNIAPKVSPDKIAPKTDNLPATRPTTAPKKQP